ncbi:cytochrome c3 family protein [Kaarinaea lacus]
MTIHGKCKALITLFFVVMLTVFVTACGSGGGNDSGPGTGSGTGTGTGNGTLPGDGTTPPPTSTVVVDVLASAGPIVAVRVGEVAVLDGSRSSTSAQEPLSFNWSFSSKPDGSNAILQDATTAQPSFTTDVRGTYMVQLVVSAAGVTSPRVIAVVEASNPDERYTGPYNHQGLSSTCVNCHNDEINQILAKAPDHLATSNMCQACHTTFGFATAAFVDHTEVFGNCSECHNGVRAIGKSQWHVETAEECDECHNTTHFLELQPDGSFDHTGILRQCQGCHNGAVATGQDADHIATSTDCGFCHTTTSFLPAYVDHSDITGNCVSCHNNVDAIGKPDTHPDTNTIDCVVCHSKVTFDLGGFFDHSVVDSVTLPCASCHNGVNALGKPSQGHVDTTADCANCHNVESFVGGFVDHSGPDVVGKRCDSCHGVTAIGKHDNHMPTTEDCAVCHTPGGTFTTGTYDHAGVVDGCETCHNNVISVGKLDNHLPTTQSCELCHNTTSFADATFDHTGIVDNCASCHDGNISMGKTANHIPTQDDCSVCHNDTNANGFANSTFLTDVHPTITGDCVSCHNGRFATGKITNHIPAQDDCSVCHNFADGFASPAKFLGTVHPGITRGCEGCHISRFLAAGFFKATDHLPTQQDCYLCHTNTAFVPASNFNHTGITGNCSSCHDGSFAAIGARGKTATPPHPATTEDCGACHNTTAFADAYVDHTSPEVLNQRCDNCHGVTATGKGPNHLPTTQDCRVCHVPGTFATAVFSHDGIVDNCASCHDGTAATATVKPANHLPTTEDCSVCHNTTAFAGATFDHTGIVDNCASCHNGTTATGKPTNHVPTNNDCSQCHFTTGFLPATFDHTGIVDNCGSCHDGTFATGKTVDHLPTSQDCGVCHNTTAFIPATFDHTGIVDGCAGCHNGTDAIGMEAKLARTGTPHIPTNLDCHFCHTTATFVGGTWDHQGITGNCVSCHDGNTATGKGPNHFDTTADCNACHSTNGWAPINYQHPNNSDYPGDHNSRVTCISCHRNNSQTITYSSPQYAPQCAACHAGDYRAGDHRGTLADNANCGRSGCHRVSSRSW